MLQKVEKRAARIAQVQDKLSQQQQQQEKQQEKQIKEIVNSSLAAPTDNQGDSVKTIPEPVSYHVECHIL